MPSDPPAASGPITGRCYCGAFSLRADGPPRTVAYCHCSDCRRVTGAPVAAFAAFGTTDIRFDPELGAGVSVNDGVRRWFCQTCGSPLAASYAYLPGQVYVALGLLDQAEALAPDIHAHAANRLTWLHITDDLPHSDGSSRDHLNAAQPE